MLQDKMQPICMFITLRLRNVTAHLAIRVVRKDAGVKEPTTARSSARSTVRRNAHKEDALDPGQGNAVI